MNTIRATYQESKYSTDEHLVILLDDEPLDKIMDTLYPDKSYLGLVSTLLFWLDDKKERKLVWDRILPNEGETSICPILMCPDDLDLWCTVIVVEIERLNNIIQWKKIGLDIGDYAIMPDQIGENIEWFDNISEYNFKLSDYENMLNPFREEVEIDEIRSDVRAWILRTRNKLNISFPKFKVMNYGIQKVHDEYEIYLTGHNSYYKDHNTWLLEAQYESEENYFGLGKRSSKLDRTEMFDLYKNEILQQIEFENIKYPSRIKITICYSDGQPERLK